MSTGPANDHPTSASNELERSKAFLRVSAPLIRAVEQRQLVIYGEVADLMGLPRQGNYTGLMTGRMLGTIVDRERACGRPMLSAVVVSSKNQQPGSGFFDLAEQMGLISPQSSSEERRVFRRAELERVYEEWSK